VTTPPVAFYCVVDDRYFLGAVGMLNSLRLVGHTEPAYVLDCGLTDLQRDLLAPHATLIPAAERTPPWLLKTIAPLRYPAEVMVLIDADIVVTRPLTRLIEDVAAGKVAAFRTSYDRFFPEWGELLGLGAVERRPYLCSALVLFGSDRGSEALRVLDEAQRRIPVPEDGWSGGRREFFRTAATFPFSALDQDALNAVLSSGVAAERVAALDHRLAPEPPFPGLRPIDEEMLRCAYDDGTEPYVLHHLGPKPWIAPVRENLYSRMLVRLLTGPGIALTVPDSELPLRLRHGRLATAGRRLAGVQDRLRSSVWEPLSWRVGSRLDPFTARRARRRDRS
jgi:hypothetical protein